jgi:L-lactate dehydrogenase complex protein LldG
MKDSTSREQVLKAVRKALIHKSEVDYSASESETEIYTAPEEESLELLFAKTFSSLKGNFIFCETKEDFPKILSTVIQENKWETVFCTEPEIKEMLEKGGVPFNSQEKDFLSCNVGITLCEYLVARTGSIIVSSKQKAGRRLPVYSNIHITVAYTSQLVYNLKDAFRLLKKKYEPGFPSQVTTITGPSQTADIEKTLVNGAHGPKEIFLFLIDDTSLGLSA